MPAPIRPGWVVATSWVALCGCADDDGRGAHENPATADTAGESTAGTGTSSSAGTSGQGSTGSGLSGSESTGTAVQRCGIDELAPGASNPLVAGDRTPMQLPLEIADIVTRSCGCHLADDLVIPGDYPASGTLDLTTWAGWQVDYGSVPTYEAARRRLDPEIPLLVMPPSQCDVGGGETMLPEDRARMLEWIAALAPDGVTWSTR